MRAFIIGATGYLGGHIAANFKAAGHDVTGFSRSESGDEKLRKLGVDIFRGDIKDRAGLIEQARAADCTVLAARVIESSWDEELDIVGGLLDGIEGMNKTVLHTSGTGVLGQQTRGDYGDGVFAEADPIWPNPIMAPRVKTENLVREAVGRGIRGIAIRPPGIWGGDVLPAHARMMMRTAHAIGQVCYVGRGLNSYTNVHVDDLAEAYRLAWEKGVPGALYHATSGEMPNRWMAEIIGRAINLPTRSVTVEEGVEYWGEYGALIVMGSSSRSTSPRARRDLGWVPTRFDLEEELQRLAKAAYADARLVHAQTRPNEKAVAPAQ
jgi:nucleoside-diphosphate-sugar epimerase